MGETPSSTAYRVKNRILASLPPDKLATLRQKMEVVRLNPRQLLHIRNAPIKSVYFLNSGLASLLVNFADGFHAEAGIVGSEGMVGLAALHGAQDEITEAMVQIPGEALRLTTAQLRQELEATPALVEALLLYSDSVRSYAMQIAACNAHHGLEQRLARWLLTVNDRSDVREVPITQEMLAMVLCVHRPSVSVAASRLQRARLIRYSAGTVSVVDRHGLEQVACECYEHIRENFRAIAE